MGENSLSIAAVLQVAGLLLLVGDLFVPSHGAMTVIALGCLGGGIYEAFQHGEIAGFVSLVATLVLLPVFAMIVVKVWPRTYVGRRVAPRNQSVGTLESPGYGKELAGLVGQTGTTITPLRPVGACSFAGKRVECVAESGMIDRDRQVVAVAVQGQALIVRPV